MTRSGQAAAIPAACRASRGSGPPHAVHRAPLRPGSHCPPPVIWRAISFRDDWRFAAWPVMSTAPATYANRAWRASDVASQSHSVSSDSATPGCSRSAEACRGGLSMLTSGGGPVISVDSPPRRCGPQASHCRGRSSGAASDPSPAPTLRFVPLARAQRRRRSAGARLFGQWRQVSTDRIGFGTLVRGANRHLGRSRDAHPPLQHSWPPRTGTRPRPALRCVRPDQAG